MRILLLVVLFSLFITRIWGQTTVIQGNVKDKASRQPIAGAVVMILQPDSTTVSSYATTDDNGKFSLSLPPNNNALLLKATSMGYSFYLTPLSKLSNNITIELSPQNNQLKEIIVKPPKIYSRKDTINYNVAEFSNAQDKTIGDVLKKLPGIDVQDDGTIMYNGKAINKFYIEGIDLLNNKYGLAVNNIAPADVQSVQLLEGHQPVKALKSTTPSDRAALNLKLKNASKNKWLGNTELEAGVSAALWKANLLALKISRKSQSLNLFQSNNIGQNITDQLKPHTLEDYLNGNQNNWEQKDIVQIVPDLPPIAASRSLFNKTFVISSNSIRQLKNDYQLRTNFNYINDRQQFNNTSNISYFNPDSATVNILEKNFAQTEQNTATAEVTLNKNSEAFFLNNKFETELRWNKITTEITGSNPNEQKASLPYDNFQNDFSFVKVYKNKTLKINSYNFYNYQPEDLHSTFNSQSNPIFQHIKQTQFINNTNVSLSTTYHRWMLDYRGGLKTNIQSLVSDLLNPANNPPLPADSLSNNLKRNLFNYYLQPTLQFSNDQLNIRVELPINFYQITLYDRFHEQQHNDHDLFFNPAFNLNYKFSPLWTAVFHAGLQTQPLGIEYLNNGYLFQNYRLINLGLIQQNISREQNYSAALNYRSAVKSLFFSFSALYSPTSTNQILQRGFINLFTIEKLVPLTNYRDFWNFSGRVSKGIDDLNAVAALSISFQTLKGQLLQTGKLVNSTTQTWRINPGYTMNLNKKLNLEYAGEFAINNLNLSGTSSTGSLLNTNQKLGLGLIISDKLNVKGSFEYYFNDLSTNKSISSFFTDFLVRYLPTKSLELNLDLKNILDKKNIAYNVFETASSTANTYAIRPFNALVGLAFKW